jgi:hypothetical protein
MTKGMLRMTKGMLRMTKGMLRMTNECNSLLTVGLRDARKISHTQIKEESLS